MNRQFLAYVKAMTAALAASLAIAGCASNPPTGPVYDPIEPVNRQVYRFNDALDRAVLKPVARGYRYVLPDFAENGIANVFSNLGEPVVIINDLLQGKIVQAGSDTGRFLLNSTVGIVGLFDPASQVGLQKHDETYGQTLGVWGVGEGPFLMLPLFGPSNGRDTTGRITDALYTDPLLYIDPADVAVGLGVLDVISTRAALLSAGNLFDTAALDPYLMLRDFWVQQHRTATLDGKGRVAIGAADEGDGSDELDELDELDAMDAQDSGDELDQLDELDRLDALDAEDDAP